MSKTLYGQTTIALGEHEYTLIPTLDAVRKIEMRFGGLRAALDALSGLSVEGTSVIIAAGAGLTTKQANQLPEQVFAAGIGEVAIQVTPFVLALLNPSKAEASDSEGNAGDDVAP